MPTAETQNNDTTQTQQPEVKQLDKMNRHELAAAAGKTIDRVKAANAALKTAFENMPATAKMAAGDQLDAAFEALDANTEMLLTTRAELGLVIRLSTL